MLKKLLKKWLKCIGQQNWDYSLLSEKLLIQLYIKLYTIKLGHCAQ